MSLVRRPLAHPASWSGRPKWQPWKPLFLASPRPQQLWQRRRTSRWRASCQREASAATARQPAAVQRRQAGRRPAATYRQQPRRCSCSSSSILLLALPLMQHLITPRSQSWWGAQQFLHPNHALSSPPSLSPQGAGSANHSRGLGAGVASQHHSRGLGVIAMGMGVVNRPRIRGWRVSAALALRRSHHHRREWRAAATMACHLSRTSSWPVFAGSPCPLYCCPRPLHSCHPRYCLLPPQPCQSAPVLQPMCPSGPVPLVMWQPRHHRPSLLFPPLLQLRAPTRGPAGYLRHPV